MLLNDSNFNLPLTTKIPIVLLDVVQQHKVELQPKYLWTLFAHGSCTIVPFTFLEWFELERTKHCYIFKPQQPWTAVSGAAIETMQADNALLKENAELKAEVQRLLLKVRERNLFLYVNFSTSFHCICSPHPVEMSPG